MKQSEVDVFFALFSDHIYGEERWLDVFRIENWTHATIREYWREMIGINDDKLIKLIINHLGNLVNRAGQVALPDDSFITEVLEREVGRISQFVADLQKTNPTEERDAFAAHFTLNAQRLQECMLRSGDFRKFIVNRPKM